MTIQINPPSATVPASGGSSTHTLTNHSIQRLAFKVKSSNNDHYRVLPVFGFVEPQSSMNILIMRTSGPAKNDKLVIQIVVTSVQETNPANAFKTKTTFPIKEITLPITAFYDQNGNTFYQPLE